MGRWQTGYVLLGLLDRVDGQIGFKLLRVVGEIMSLLLCRCPCERCDGKLRVQGREDEVKSITRRLLWMQLAGGLLNFQGLKELTLSQAGPEPIPQTRNAASTIMLTCRPLMMKFARMIQSRLESVCIAIQATKSSMFVESGLVTLVQNWQGVIFPATLLCPSCRSTAARPAYLLVNSGPRAL